MGSFRHPEGLCSACREGEHCNLDGFLIYPCHPFFCSIHDCPRLQHGPRHRAQPLLLGIIQLWQHRTFSKHQRLFQHTDASNWETPAQLRLPIPRRLPIFVVVMLVFRLGSSKRGLSMSKVSVSIGCFQIDNLSTILWVDHHHSSDNKAHIFDLIQALPLCCRYSNFVG